MFWGDLPFEVIATQTTISNHLLDRLSPALRSALENVGQRVGLKRGERIYDAGGPVRYVYLPVDGIISIVSVMQDGTQIEVTTIGREGAAGAQILLDRGDSTTSMTYVQIPGEALRVEAGEFVTLAATYPELALMIGKYLSALIDVMAQSTACNRLHYVNERCARWLLSTADRVGRDEFALTHETMATMLGVRRAGVSISCASLQNAGYIAYSRGHFRVVDRAGLRTAACECYDAINRAFDRRGLRAG